VIIEGCAGTGIAGHLLSKEVLLVVSKKTSRSTKTSPQSAVTPDPIATTARARSGEAKAKITRRRSASAPAVNGASPGPTPNGAALAAVAAPRLITDEDIRLRAYFLSLEHAGQGSPEYFWHLAERQLRGGSH
jgi:hypothetical protein